MMKKKRDLNLQLTVNQSLLYGDYINLKSVPDSVPHIWREMIQLMVQHLPRGLYDYTRVSSPP